MKKLLSIILASTMIFSATSMINVSAAADTPETTETAAVQETTPETVEPTVPATEETTPYEDNTKKDYTYSINDETVAITKYNGNAKSVTIPDTIEGKAVKIIEKEAFMDNSKIQRVTIGGNVTTIGEKAFANCKKLASVTFGKNVKSIGWDAFSDCKRLKTVTLPSKLKKLKPGVFQNTALHTIKIGENIESISPSALWIDSLMKITVASGNKNYSSKAGVLYNKAQTRLIVCPRSIDKKQLTIPSTVKKIADYAFERNKTLGKVKLPKKLKTIGVGAFSECKKLESIKIPDTVYEINEDTFNECENLKKVTMGKKVSEIGIGAFFKCKKLKSIKIPSKVTELELFVLIDTGVKSLNIGKNIEKISTMSFSTDSNIPMEKITVSKDNKYYSSQDGVLYNKDKTELLFCPPSLKKKSLTIPSSVKTINAEAFAHNKNLTTVKLPNKLHLIKDYAFSACENLKEITLPKSVSYIYDSAFYSCKKLTKINILNKNAVFESNAFGRSGVKSVEVAHDIYEGFRGCDKLQKVTILPNVKSIDAGQFFDCPKLKTVTIPKTVKEIGKKAFGYKYKIVNGFYKGIVKVKGFTIKGAKNSAAHKYAKKNGFKFVAI
ncbi:MAG: leucine-rich repeat domain-containing protein [Ruminococcus sp.]|nr:leucine-rich repeat domain-containing protein [Ruminococcus sp.]